MAVPGIVNSPDLGKNYVLTIATALEECIDVISIVVSVYPIAPGKLTLASLRRLGFRRKLWIERFMISPVSAWHLCVLSHGPHKDIGCGAE
jgi:hypothetical protein